MRAYPIISTNLRRKIQISLLIQNKGIFFWERGCMYIFRNGENHNINYFLSFSGSGIQASVIVCLPVHCSPSSC